MADGSSIETLLSLGNDAMDNMFDVVYQAGAETNSFRISGRLTEFNPPPWTVEKHDIAYHGHTISLPSTKVNMDRKLELNFRMDANYEWYDYWRQLAQYAGSGNTGGVANAPVNTGTLIVTCIKGNIVGAGPDGVYGAPITEGLQWIYKDCWVADVTEPNFKTDGGNTQEFKVTIYFARSKYPSAEDAGAVAGMGV